MIVTDIVTIIGRGNVVCCDDKTELVNNHVKIGDKLKINDTTFELIGFESWEYQKRCGLVLRPNDIVRDVVHINDTVSIVKDS